jgi:hypothetical protein
MSRLVQPQARPGDSTRSGGLEATTGSAQGDEYASRVAKYIPSEVLAGYLTLEGLLNPVTRKAAGGGVLDKLTNDQVAAGIFLVGLVFTPLYILIFGLRSRAPWVTHALMATLAFCVWAYAMKGSVFQLPVAGLTLYDGTLAAAILVVFSLVSGLVKPHGS